MYRQIPEKCPNCNKAALFSVSRGSREQADGRRRSLARGLVGFP